MELYFEMHAPNLQTFGGVSGGSFLTAVDWDQPVITWTSTKRCYYCQNRLSYQMLFALGFKYSDEYHTARRAFTVMPGVHGASGTRVSVRFTPSATVGGAQHQ